MDICIGEGSIPKVNAKVYLSSSLLNISTPCISLNLHILMYIMIIFFHMDICIETSIKKVNAKN